MKRTLAAIMAILTLALSVIGFTACGKDKIDENTNLSDLKSEKLDDAAAWDAAFSAEKFETFSLKFGTSAKYGEETVKDTVSYRFAGDKAYFRGLTEYSNEKSNGAVVYISKTADEFKVYTWGITDGKDDEAFLLTGEAAKNNGGEVYGTGKYGYDRINSIKDIKFENVTYSDDEKGYVYEQSENGSSVKGVIKFSDGRFVGVSSESSVGENKESFNLIVYNVGKTTVELPEAMTAEPAHSHTFAAEWRSNESSHWHDCTVEGCTAKNDFAAHTWNDGVITVPAQANVTGVKTFTCTVCGKTKTEDVAALTAVTSADWTALHSELEKMKNASALTTTMKTVSDGDFYEVIIAYDKQTGKTVEKDTMDEYIGVFLIYPDNEKYVRIGFPVVNGAVVNDNVYKDYVPKEYGYKYVQDDITIIDITESILEETLIGMLKWAAVSQFEIQDQSGSRVSIGDNDIDLSIYVTANNGVSEINGVARVKSSAINGWRIEEEDSDSANTEYSTVRSLEIRYTLAFSDGCVDANMSMEAIVETSDGTDQTLGVYSETKYESSFDTALYNEMKELANGATYSGEVKDVSADIDFFLNGIWEEEFDWLHSNSFNGISYTDKTSVWQKAQDIAEIIKKHFNNNVSVKIYLDKAHTREFTNADDITIDCVDGAELYFEVMVTAGQNKVLVVKQYGCLDRYGEWNVNYAMMELVDPATDYALFDEHINASEQWSKITVNGAEHSLDQRTIDITGKSNETVVIYYYGHVVFG